MSLCIVQVVLEALVNVLSLKMACTHISFREEMGMVKDVDTKPFASDLVSSYIF